MLFYRVGALILIEKHLKLPCNAKQLNNRNIILLTGQLSKSRRAAVIEQMTTDPTCLAFTTYQVGGVGHNFQAFHIVVILDRNWNPQVSVNKCSTHISR